MQWCQGLNGAPDGVSWSVVFVPEQSKESIRGGDRGAAVTAVRFERVEGGVPDRRESQPDSPRPVSGCQSLNGERKASTWRHGLV